MVRQGGFAMRLDVNRRPVKEILVQGQPVASAAAGSAFEVVITNSNRAVYLVKLLVDGVEAEPGYLKKLRGEDQAVFRGFVCRRDVHEFLFARTPVDEGAPSSSARAAEGLGEVKALIYATRRIRMESDSGSDSDGRTGHQSYAALEARALPEKQAVKEYALQARAGGLVESIARHQRRRRGDYRLEKVKPEVATLSLLYRDAFWFARHTDTAASSSDGLSAGSCAANVIGSSGHVSNVKQEGSSGARGNIVIKQEGSGHDDSSRARGISEGHAADAVGGTAGARPLMRRKPGETGRGLDGKRRKLAVPPGDGSRETPEVICLSD